jgi:hypothetical protein
MRAARVSALVTVATLAASCSAPFLAPAAALEPGVQIDPGSPAAKEYVLPVGQARRTGSGREATPSSPAQESAESASEPLFGAGITPPSSGGRPNRGGRSPGGSHSHGAVGHGSTRSQARGAPDQQPPALVRRVAAGHASSGGGSSALVLLAGAIGLLALAAFAGIVLRHSRRPTATS